jgi:hypothetical protein
MDIIYKKKYLKYKQKYLFEKNKLLEVINSNQIDGGAFAFGIQGAKMLLKNKAVRGLALNAVKGELNKTTTSHSTPHKSHNSHNIETKADTSHNIETKADKIQKLEEVLNNKIDEILKIVNQIKDKLDIPKQES